MLQLPRHAVILGSLKMGKSDLRAQVAVLSYRITRLEEQLKEQRSLRNQVLVGLLVGVFLAVVGFLLSLLS